MVFAHYIYKKSVMGDLLMNVLAGMEYFGELILELFHNR